MRRAAVPAVLAACGGAAGHGVLTLPASRNGGALSTVCKMPRDERCCWFSDQTRIPGAPANCAAAAATLRGGGCAAADAELRTHPWMAPGSAPVRSPCGNQQVQGGAPGRADGRDLPPAAAAEWRAGGEAEVGFAIQYNHGGGYAYRLCPAAGNLTEACFAAHHLAFARSTSVVRWANGSEAPIPAVDTAEGTSPAGSVWRRNPVPTEERKGAAGGAPFPAPCAGCAGDGGARSVVDRVRVPAALPPGDYVLSWRWDCEVNAQVWLNCADVVVAAAAPPAPAPAPAPDRFVCDCAAGLCARTAAGGDRGVPEQTCRSVCPAICPPPAPRR